MEKDSNMEHNLEESLNLEGSIGVDFERSGNTVVDQSEITLEAGTSHEESIPMEYQHIEEQPMLMDTGSEEIIDFMGDQFTLQEYSVHDDQMSGETTTVAENQQVASERMLDLQFEQQPISVPASGIITQEVHMQPKYITVKAGAPTVRAIAPRKETMVISKSIAPRQVAIAPKPTKLVSASMQKLSAAFGKPFAIAPKPSRPVALVANRQGFNSIVKKVSVGGTQDSSKGNTVLAQIGKQLAVMVPTSSGQKIKLVAAAPGAMGTMRVIGTDGEHAQLIPQFGAQVQKPVKVIVQGVSVADSSQQPAVITKLVTSGAGAGAGGPPTRYVTMHQKTVPISIANNKVLMGSPTKAGVRFAKKQVITFKSPTSKLAPASLGQGTTTKRVVISANPTQNVILKTTAPPKLHVAKSGQKTQLHQINVPGKGIQYIKLVTNPSSSVKPAPKPLAAATTPKTFVLTDSKGNLIRMTAEKMSSQPPPLLVTGGGGSVPHKVLTPKSQQKLVRIAPTSKSGQTAMNRGGQSLLAPMSPTAGGALPDVAALLEDASRACEGYEEGQDELERVEHTETDSKAALQALIADAVGSDADSQDGLEQAAAAHTQGEHYSRRQSSECSDSNSADRAESAADHPLIVIPSYLKQDMIVPDQSNFEDARRLGDMINVEVDPYDPYQDTSQQLLSDGELVSGELGLRPRKACNCTKSQCLKLYCDCFANGEFCNRCNCNNCHNNLENEELRQKAIRGCLDRNPNAFRPKIGKSKTGGPEMIRRHNKGCNCKRSGCLKNYCECYEAKIACTSTCKCVGCRNVEETLERARRRQAPAPRPDALRAVQSHGPSKQPCSFMTMEVIEAVCQCLVAAAVEGAGGGGEPAAPPDPVRDVIDEFARCLQDIISASHQATPLALLDETQA